jgi:cell division protein FtsL
MPLSTDNQDYGQKDKKNEESGNLNKPKNGNTNSSQSDEMTSDNLKGKKVDADPAEETDKPADV